MRPRVPVPTRPRIRTDAGRACSSRSLESIDDRTHRIALLDSLPGEGLAEAVEHWQRCAGADRGAETARSTSHGSTCRQQAASPRWVPPCGHVAGVIARTDRQVGVHKAPANERLEGVLDLEDERQHDATSGPLDPHAVVNCLRAFPGRGIRVWGARTTSGEADWRYVSVRRLFLTMARWFELHMADVRHGAERAARCGRGSGAR